MTIEEAKVEVMTVEEAKSKLVSWASHATGTNYWTLDVAPSKAGYTRMVTSTSSSNANVIITGWRLSNNSVVLETINTASSA